MNDFAQTFEELRIWQQARKQAKEVYTEFGGESVSSRDFGFRDQIQRAGVSVMNNIAEGFERHSPTEFAHFLNIAKASCGEVRSMLYLAEDLSYIPHEKATELRSNSTKLSKSIETLAGKLRNKS